MPVYLIVSYNDICASRTFPSDFRGEKKADQLPGNSSGNCRGWAYDIVVLIDAVRDCCDACFVFHLPKRLEIILIVVLIKYAHIEQISV